MAKIMLVEDDNNLREIYEARLQAEGYTLVSAKDGEEALVMAKNEHPDLIISDIMMPKVSGFEMLDILRNTEGLKDVKIIMLTALGQSDDQQRADRLGANRYLVKSQVTLEDIVKASQELLNENSGVISPQPEAVGPAAETSTMPVTDVVSKAPITPEVSEVTEAPKIAPADDMPMAATIEPSAEITPSISTAVPTNIPVLDQPFESDTEDSQTSAQEEAELSAKVDAFVAGKPDIELPNSPIITPEIDVKDNDDSNTQVMSEAIDSLIPTPTQNPVDTQPAVEVTTPEATPEITTAESPIPEHTDTNPAPDSGSVTNEHKKVISPLESEDKPDATKPDLNALLAIEEAKEEAAAAKLASDSANPEATAEPTKPVDPNNIAL